MKRVPPRKAAAPASMAPSAGALSQRSEDADAPAGTRDAAAPPNAHDEVDLLPPEWRPVHFLGYLAIIAILVLVLSSAAWMGYRRLPADATGLWTLTFLLALPMVGAACFEAYNDRLRSRRFLEERARRLSERPGARPPAAAGRG